MNKFKKTLALLCILAVTFGFTACGEEAKAPTAEEDEKIDDIKPSLEAVEEAEAEEAAAETEEETTEEATEEPTE